MARGLYRLIGRIQQVAHAFRTRTDRLLIDAADVTTAQAGVLAVIADDPGCSQRDVARRLRLGESALVAAVGRLASAGLVERHSSKHDPRAGAHFLTSRGVDTAARAQQTFRGIDDLLDALGEDGRARFAELLDALDQMVSSPERRDDAQDADRRE
ncbi:MarR family winged helix-turn-helix transcriptional regulator [Nocardia pneumoniae]|uniref:MarR family winged helix-turn-helix transcriptional regulator n=1 Tax=Nocardia pneumoniae TaxID=228601 RepID=UPI000304F99C|nr:MarR family transcriptional regulator [Nocardia pneumoniae]